LRSTLEDKREVLGDEHASTLYTVGILSRVYRDEGKYAQAEPLLLERVAAARLELDTDPEPAATAMEQLASCYIEQGKIEQAELVLDEALAVSRRAGSDSLTAAAQADLACVRAAQARSEEALDLLTRAVDAGWAVPARLDHPALATLAGDPRFQALAARVRAEDGAR
jgi:predicted negative regulator of RcsB-dependent stress response